MTVTMRLQRVLIKTGQNLSLGSAYLRNRYFMMVCDFNDCLEKIVVVKVKNSR